jgi:hypothetical protein
MAHWRGLKKRYRGEYALYLKRPKFIKWRNISKGIFEVSGKEKSKWVKNYNSNSEY